jgi:hypothetical protein
VQELHRAIVDCGFEHPSEGSYVCCTAHAQITHLLFLDIKHHLRHSILSDARPFHPNRLEDLKLFELKLRWYRLVPFYTRTVQHECIPQAILGMDVLCQAKSGMGKTAVFVLSVLQQIEPTTPAEVSAIVLCHTRELAYQVALCPKGVTMLTTPTCTSCLLLLTLACTHTLGYQHVQLVVHT